MNRRVKITYSASRKTRNPATATEPDLPFTFFGKRFESKRIDTLAAIPPETVDRDLLAAYPHAGPGDNHELLFATLDVIYHQDARRAEHVCRAAANFARVVLARSRYRSQWGKVEQDIGGIKGLSGIAAGLGHLWYRGGADFALAYDYLYDYMTPDQRDVCRRALSAATKDLVTWGMRFPRGRAVSNWYGYHGELGPMLLAIEGEEGYRADQWEQFRQAIRDWAEVHIDGKAEAEAGVGRGKAPSARLVQYGDVGNEDGFGVLSYGVMDLKNAYDWLWTHSWEKPGEDWEPETRSFEELGWTWKRSGQPPALFGHDDQNAPGYNFMGCNLWRAPNNPVEFCWRTGVLVRGPHPYAIIVDDVKKDDQQRAYDWYGQVPDDVEFAPQANGYVLFAERNEQRTYDRPNVGSRRLLVAPLGPGKPAVKLEEYASGISRGEAHRARRLVISRQAREGRFRVLVFPFRTTVPPAGSSSREDWARHPAGAVLPTIGPAARSGFFLKFDGRKDEWVFAPGEQGRSRILLKRGGEQWRID